jgi:hypothetical protein
MEETKNRYKIWDWEIRKRTSSNLNPEGSVGTKTWYAMDGISNQYHEGRRLTTSRILRVDFEKKEVETRNSIYELQDGVFPKDIKETIGV